MSAEESPLPTHPLASALANGMIVSGRVSADASRWYCLEVRPDDEQTLLVIARGDSDVLVRLYREGQSLLSAAVATAEDAAELRLTPGRYTLSLSTAAEEAPYNVHLHRDPRPAPVSTVGEAGRLDDDGTIAPSDPAPAPLRRSAAGTLGGSWPHRSHSFTLLVPTGYIARLRAHCDEGSLTATVETRSRRVDLLKATEKERTITLPPGRHRIRLERASDQASYRLDVTMRRRR